MDIQVVQPRNARGIFYQDAEVSRMEMIQFTANRKYAVGVKHVWGANIAQNRTTGVKAALDVHKPKWVFFLDDDMVVPQDCLIRMIEADRDIVSGFCVMRKKPFIPCAWMRDTEKGKFYKPIAQWPDDQLVEVDAVGGACMLVKTDVFRNLKRPWFHFYSDSEMDMGEDLFFCRKAKRKGYKIWLDTGLVIGHIGDCAYTIYDYMNFRDQQEDMKRRITQNVPKSKILVAR